ncbi:MAG: 3-isopropylmalate dehydratase small subunit [Acidobacteria bacterium]|nr:3-isopropylmalate dehydratase small subunit [Acidobacteriota bacterium]
MRVVGRVLRMGDHVDTDVIIPGRYLRTADPASLATHVFEPLGLDPADLAGRIIVAGRNFGCGSSREQAPLALKSAGVGCIVAESFARIFFRNAINVGLPAVECVRAGSADDGDELLVDLRAGRIENRTRGWVSAFEPYPDFVMEILEAGGLINRYRRGRDG